MSAIEVLKKDIISYEEIRKSGKKCLTTNNEECCFVHYPEIKEVLLALEQKDYLLRELNEIKKLVGDLNDFREELHIDSYEDLELIEHIESIEKVIKRAKKEIHKQRIKELEEGVVDE